MKTFAKILFGRHYISTLCGYITAGLITYQTSLQNHATTHDIILAVGIAVLGRISADADKVNNHDTNINKK